MNEDFGMNGKKVRVDSDDLILAPQMDGEFLDLTKTVKPGKPYKKRGPKSKKRKK